jgi:hypothetical protein
MEPSGVDEFGEVSLTLDDRAAMRAFLQRCEVRLSTMHRVATALLSGAGILVLLPALERDAVVQVLRTLLVGPVSVTRALLTAALILAIGLALAVFWLLVQELTAFYFHSNHIRNDADEFFTPRFTLTGLRISSDELSFNADRAYEAVHGSAPNVELLVPKNAQARERIDLQLAAYPGLFDPNAQQPDAARATALFDLAASRRRTLTEEVSKVEYGIVRHVIRLQIIVLRYVKALLVIVATALAAFACAAAVSNDRLATGADERWIAGVLMLWAPAVMVVVASPMRWLEGLLRAEGAQHTALGDDTELMRAEDFTVRVAMVAWVIATTAMVLLVTHHDVSPQGRGAVIVTIVISTSGVIGYLIRRSRAVQARLRR